MISFVIPIEPVAKGRPRFTRMGRAYTDDKTRAFEKAFGLAAAKYRPKAPLLGPLVVDLAFVIRRKKSVKRKEPCVRPDVDNFCKAVIDSLSGFWVDDGQIVGLHARKLYGDAPAVHVEIAYAQ